MGNKIKIGVMINHYLFGQGRRYTCDLEPFYIDEQVLNDKVLFQEVVNDYCKQLASVMTPYNTDFEDYTLWFWRDNQKIVKKVLLSDYSDFFSCDSDDCK